MSVGIGGAKGSSPQTGQSSSDPVQLVRDEKQREPVPEKTSIAYSLPVLPSHKQEKRKAPEGPGPLQIEGLFSVL